MCRASFLEVSGQGFLLVRMSGDIDAQPKPPYLHLSALASVDPCGCISDIVLKRLEIVSECQSYD